MEEAKRARKAESGNAETAKPTPKVKRAVLLSRPPFHFDFDRRKQREERVFENNFYQKI